MNYTFICKDKAELIDLINTKFIRGCKDIIETTIDYYNTGMSYIVYNDKGKFIRWNYNLKSYYIDQLVMDDCDYLILGSHVIDGSFKPTWGTYSVGDKFKHESGDVYMIMVYSNNMVGFNCIDDGRRWNNPVKISDYDKINMDEFISLVGGNNCIKFTKIEQDEE